MKLQAKLVSSFLGLASVAIAIGLVNISLSQKLNLKVGRLSNNTVPKLVALGEIKVASLRIMTEVSNYALTQSELDAGGESTSNLLDQQDLERTEFTEAAEELEKWVERLNKIYQNSEENKFSTSLIHSFAEDLERIGHEIIVLKQKGVKGNEVLAKQTELEELEEEFIELMDRQIELAIANLKRENRETTRQANFGIAIQPVLAIGVAILAVILGLVLAENIAKPIDKLKNAATEISKGNLAVTVDIQSANEIGTLATAFNLMVEELKKPMVSKQYVDNIFRSLIEALIVVDNRGIIIDFNLATLILLNYEEEEELLGKLASEIIADCALYNPEENEIEVSQSFIGRKERELIAKNGTKIPVYFSASLIYDDRGEIQAIVCLAQDIRDRKKAEAALRESEQRYQTLAGISPVGIFRMSEEGQFVYTNDRLREITGLTDAELRSQDWTATIHEADRDRVVEEWTTSVEQNLPFHCEFRFLHPNGKETWVLGQAVTQTDREGNVTGYVGTITNISDRKQAEVALQKVNEQLENRVRERTAELSETLQKLQQESVERQIVAEALHESQERLNGILHSIDDVVWSVSATTREALYLSPAVEKVYGQRASKFFKNPNLWREMIHPQDRDRADFEFQEGFETHSADVEYRIIRPSGELCWLRQRMRVVCDAEGNPLRIDGIATDITHRKKVEAALRKSEIRYRKLAKQEALVNRLTEQIRNSLDIDKILQTAVTEIRSLLQIDRCAFIWYHPQDLSIHHSETASEDASDSAPSWQVIKESKNPDLHSSIGTYPANPNRPAIVKLLNREIIQVEDANNSQKLEYEDLITLWGYTAFVMLPIQTRSGDVGLVSCAQCSGPRRWSHSEMLLLEAIANQLAIAISQAELYTRATHSATQAREKAQQLQHTLRELQKTQSQLIQTEKMSSLGQMVAGVAHEINNPVSFIYGNIEPANEYIDNLLALLALYQQHYPEPVREIQEEIEAIELDFVVQDLRKLLSSMKIGADRIREIVLSLRNFSRLDEAKMKAVDLHQGIDSTLLILQHRLKAKPGRPEIQVIKEYGKLPPIECYGGELNQVFMNLLGNAIDALELRVTESGVRSPKNTPHPSPTIRIHTKPQGDNQIEIRISDNGIGMTQEVRQRIFDPFFTTKPVGKGTGLGLSISYQIVVEKHCGQFRCISQPEKGTTFLIILPIRQKYSHSPSVLPKKNK